MAQQKKRKPSYVSPIGVAGYPWLNRPDMAYFENGKKSDRPNPNGGVYKVDLRLTSEEFHDREYRDGKSFQQWLDALVDASVEEARREYPKFSKQIKPHYPYEAETDDTGEETGEYKIKFRQNAKIKRKDGTIVDVTIPLYNRAGRLIEDPIYGGSMIQVAFTVRNTWMANDKKAGVRLDIAAVRVLKLVKTERSASDFGFEVEDDEAPEPAGGDYDETAMGPGEGDEPVDF